MLHAMQHRGVRRGVSGVSGNPPEHHGLARKGVACTMRTRVRSTRRQCPLWKLPLKNPVYAPATCTIYKICILYVYVTCMQADISKGNKCYITNITCSYKILKWCVCTCMYVIYMYMLYMIHVNNSTPPTLTHFSLTFTNAYTLLAV